MMDSYIISWVGPDAYIITQAYILIMVDVLTLTKEKKCLKFLRMFTIDILWCDRIFVCVFFCQYLELNVYLGRNLI